MNNIGYASRGFTTATSKSYGVTVLPDPIYEYPEGHPCHGCVFRMKVNKPRCMAGSDPSTGDCVNAMFRRIKEQQCIEREKRLKLSESTNSSKGGT